MTRKRFNAFCSLRSQKEGGNVVHFSDFARKVNHFPSLFARAKRMRKGIYFFVMYLGESVTKLRKSILGPLSILLKHESFFTS